MCGGMSGMWAIAKLFLCLNSLPSTASLIQITSRLHFFKVQNTSSICHVLRTTVGSFLLQHFHCVDDENEMEINLNVIIIAVISSKMSFDKRKTEVYHHRCVDITAQTILNERKKNWDTKMWMNRGKMHINRFFFPPRHRGSVLVTANNPAGLERVKYLPFASKNTKWK